MNFLDFDSYPRWLSYSVLLFLLLDFFLLWRYFRNPQREDKWEFFCRILGSNFFGFYLFYRIHLKIADQVHNSRYQTFFSWIQWLLIVFPFALFFWSYLFRIPAKAVANRFREIIFPLFVAIMPFGVYESNQLIGPWIRRTPALYSFLKVFYPFPYRYFDWAASAFVFAGDLIAFLALIYLRHSFSIMVEVRNMQLEGPYLWIRHPMYLGEILATIGFCLFKFSYFNVCLTIVFIFCLSLRARFEEDKMSQFYPEYKDYKARTGFLFPKL